ncbi:hypothetical protein SS50377_21188 [Spironucleus salmonicida]|uniref:Uncharacterized protein n=1 Tax=Spironucleus salmonicida TaxID=348837 RepID=V6LT45_9EUKA|nr:hypothetical protein SS50377_21188 [Spironucleus salmonicida]|eukprot:EST43964.1 hypothetical protein SS50377_16271 [Spironucleus salmonicida]
MTNQIRIKFDRDKEKTNLFTIPDPIYRFIYESDLLSTVYVREQRIFLTLATTQDNDQQAIVRIFVLKPLQQISQQILSCQLVLTNDNLEILAKETVQTELDTAFSFPHKVTPSFNKQVQKVFDSWYKNQFKE